MIRSDRAFVRTVFAAVVLLAATLSDARAQQCAQPVSSGAAPVASDCLFILGAAVGAQTCSPECICAPTGTLPPKATDALLCLSSATGQPVALDCPCDDEPPDADAIIGYADADRDTIVIPPFIPGLPAIVSDSFSLGAAFWKITGTPQDIDATTTTETFGVCTVTTTESTHVSDGSEPPFTVTNYDPGSPGEATNGTVSVDMVRESFGGFESFDPDGDPFALGFDGGQTVTFSWPGGTHIEAFTDSVGVPPAVEITSPDLESAGFDVTPGSSVAVQWVPGTDDDGKLAVEVFSSVTEITQGPGDDTTIHIESVSVVCLFPDADGAGTIPAAATADLQTSATPPALFSKVFSAHRENTKNVGVNAPTVGGPRVVVLSGTSSVSRSLVSGFPF